MRQLFIAAAALALASLARAQTAPAITTQPASKTVTAGTAVTFTVVATGTTPSYQWTFDGNPISGATSASYVLSSAQPTNAGVYAVTVSNAAGSVTSSNATLLIYVPYVVKTLAGVAGSAGYANANGTAASFSHPQGLALDGAGDVYVADTANDVIREIDPSGNVTLVAGRPGVPGAVDGAAASAEFDNPTAVAVDGSGTVYVADCFNSTIRKISNGVVSTIAGLAPTAGTPNEGSTNGTGTAARFDEPRGLTLDGRGNLWIVDTYNSTVRQLVLSSLAVTTYAGSAGATPEDLDGTGANARFDYPFGIACDSSGDLWVADTSSPAIREVASGAVVTTYAGLAGNSGSAGGTGSIARFNQPTGIAVDSQGDVFVADMGNDVIREVLPGGTVVTLVGLAGNTGSVDAAGSSARLSSPFAVAVNASGTLYIADTENDTIRIAFPEPATDVAPAITTQPASTTSVKAGQSFTLSVAATGTPAPTYQWQLNGVNVAGATGASYTVASAQAADAGSYTVVVANEDATVTSSTATVTVLSAPAVTAPPLQDQSAAVGGNATFMATATGGGLTYQWYANGIPIPNSNSAVLVLSPVQSFESGTITVTVTNSVGSATTTVATLSVASSARLVNLSAHGMVGTGVDDLAIGFSISSAPKAVLIRGVGPTLTTFGLSGVLANPDLVLNSYTGAQLASNAGWGNSAALSAIFDQVGAFPLTENSTDAALYEPSLAANTYTATVSGLGGGTGLAIAEIYDADTGTPAGRLVNLSARANTGTGTAVLTGGFYISGSSDETVLLRGVGPTLTTFGFSGVLAKPVLAVYNSAGTEIASNTGWGGSATLSAIFSEVGAFTLPATSADSALVTTLAPGAYTVEVSGSGNTTGLALVEIYEVPTNP